MSRRAYVLLYKYLPASASVQLFIPLKRDDAAEYAGMPQFFGGDQHTGETDAQTIARELQEESNNMLSLNGALNKVYEAPGNKDDLLTFYVCDQFKAPAVFIGDLKGNTEMKSIESVRLPLAEKIPSDTEDLLELMKISSVSKDFGTSNTYTAFEKALAWLNTNIKVTK